MDNYREKRSGGYSPKNGNRERSFNNDFNGEYRKKSRPRFNKDADARGQYVKVDRSDSYGNSVKSHSYGRQYGSDVPRSDGEHTRRYNGDKLQYVNAFPSWVDLKYNIRETKFITNAIGESGFDTVLL